MNAMLSPSDKIIIAYSVQKYLLDQCHDWSINGFCIIGLIISIISNIKVIMKTPAQS